jgi:hypothetical protein
MFSKQNLVDVTCDLVEKGSVYLNMFSVSTNALRIMSAVTITIEDRLAPTPERLVMVTCLAAGSKCPLILNWMLNGQHHFLIALPPHLFNFK